MERYHVLPNNDIIEHVESEDCPCAPRVEIHGDGVVIVHNAMDRREVFEQRKLYNEQGATPCTDTMCNSCGRLIGQCECVDSNGQSVWKQRGPQN